MTILFYTYVLSVCEFYIIEERTVRQLNGKKKGRACEPFHFLGSAAGGTSREEACCMFISLLFVAAVPMLVPGRW